MISNMVVIRDNLGCRRTIRENPMTMMQDVRPPQAPRCIRHLSDTMISEALPVLVLVRLIAPLVPDRLIHFRCTLLQFDLD